MCERQSEKHDKNLRYSVYRSQQAPFNRGIHVFMININMQCYVVRYNMTIMIPCIEKDTERTMLRGSLALTTKYCVEVFASTT